MHTYKKCRFLLSHCLDHVTNSLNSPSLQSHLLHVGGAHIFKDLGHEWDEHIVVFGEVFLNKLSDDTEQVHGLFLEWFIVDIDAFLE